MANPLLDAIKNDDFDKVLSILNQNPSLNSALLNKEYSYQDGIVEQEVSAIPLHVATFLSNPDLVALMLEEGADSNFESNHLGCKPLDWAIAPNNLSNDDMVSKKIKIINLLCNYGAEIDDEMIQDCLSRSGELLFQNKIQLFQNNNKIIKSLMYRKMMNEFLVHVSSGDISKVSECLSNTYTVLDLYSKKHELCELKIDVNYDSGVDGYAILYAAMLPTPDMLDLLFKNGADLTAVDSVGCNVFHYAARKGSVKNIAWLSQKLPTSDTYRLINAGNKINYDTPLHLATKYHYADAVDALLFLGSNQKNMDSQKKTPKDLDKTKEVEKIFQMYPEKGVPTLLWLATRKVAQNNLSLVNNKTKIHDLDQTINLFRFCLRDKNSVDTEKKNNRRERANTL